MFTTADFVAQYKDYSDEQLASIYAQQEEYSPEGQGALQIVIKNRGGMEAFQERLKANYAVHQEINRIKRETAQLGANGVDLDLIKSTTRSQILSEEAIGRIVAGRRGHTDCILHLKRNHMPTKQAMDRAKRDAAEGKSPSTQAGEFVRQEMDEIRAGKHGARNSKQAIAIGLSEARRAGIDVGQPKKGSVSGKTRKQAQRDTGKGQRHEPVSKTRSQARTKALQKESTASASPRALSQQTRSAAAKRSPSERSAAAKKASATKGPVKRSAAAKKAARTRAGR